MIAFIFLGNGAKKGLRHGKGGASFNSWPQSSGLQKVGNKMKQTLTHILIGAAMGALVSAALFGPFYVSIERATPSGFNVFVGDAGYHFAGAAK